MVRFYGPKILRQAENNCFFKVLTELSDTARGKYFANSSPFSDGRVSINLISPVEFVCERIRTYLLIHKLYQNQAFVCLWFLK